MYKESQVKKKNKELSLRIAEVYQFVQWIFLFLCWTNLLRSYIFKFVAQSSKQQASKQSFKIPTISRFCSEQRGENESRASLDESSQSRIPPSTYHSACDGLTLVGCHLPTKLLTCSPSSAKQKEKIRWKKSPGLRWGQGCHQSLSWVTRLWG